MKSPKFEIKIRLERLKIQTAEIMVLMVHSSICGNLLKSFFGHDPKTCFDTDDLFSIK
jgi:hypothetical protein